MSIGFPLSFAAVAFSRNVKRLVVHDLPGMKPCWLLFRPFIMDSRILQGIVVRKLVGSLWLPFSNLFLILVSLPLVSTLPVHCQFPVIFLK